MSQEGDSFTKIKPSSERKGSTRSPDAYHRPPLLLFVSNTNEVTGLWAMLL